MPIISVRDEKTMDERETQKKKKKKEQQKRKVGKGVEAIVKG